MTDHQHTGTTCWLRACNRLRFEFKRNGFCHAYDTCSAHLTGADIRFAFPLGCCQEEAE